MTDLTDEMIGAILQRGGATVTAVGAGNADYLDNEILPDDWWRNVMRLTLKSRVVATVLLTLYRAIAAALTTTQIGSPFMIANFTTIILEATDPKLPLFRFRGDAAANENRLTANVDGNSVSVDADYYDSES